MRILILAAAFLSGLSAYAQDPGMQAAQMASDAATQAAQQAAAAAQQATQQAMSDANNAAQQAQLYSSGSLGCIAPAPKLSLRSGSFQGPQTVVFRDRAAGAVMFYTTDGWTPTLSSQRFRGPIHLNHTTHLQVVAMVPGCAPSTIVEAQYNLPDPAAPSVTLLPEGPASVGTKVRLRTLSDLSTKTARIGDSLPLTNAAPVEIRGHTFPEGTLQASAVITEVHRGGIFSGAAALGLSVKTLQVGASTFSLEGDLLAAASEGSERAPRSVTAGRLVSMQGRDAIVPAGAVLTARVAQDAVNDSE